jgi:hypothetical protein
MGPFVHEPREVCLRCGLDEFGDRCGAGVGRYSPPSAGESLGERHGLHRVEFRGGGLERDPRVPLHERLAQRADVRRYPTGGSGSHDLSNSGVLDADQEVITNPQRTLLFAVNSSSDTIAVFHIRAGGGLTPVAGSPFGSNGKAPSSLGLAGSTLIVANKAQDGVRDLRSVPPNYTSFHVRSDGSLGRAMSSIRVPPGSSPLQAYVTPDHKVLITSEESGVLRAFRIGRRGTLRQGPRSTRPGA